MLLCSESGSKYGWVKILRTRGIMHVELSNVFSFPKATLRYHSRIIPSWQDFTLIPAAGNAVPWGVQKLKYPWLSHALTHTRTRPQRSSRHGLKRRALRVSVTVQGRQSAALITISFCLVLFAFPLSSWASHMHVLVARWQQFLTVPLWWKSPGQRLVNRWVWLVWEASWSAPPLPLTPLALFCLVPGLKEVFYFFLYPNCSC